MVNQGSGAAVRPCVSEVRPVRMEGEVSATNVYEIDPLCDSRWKTFVESHPLASVFHSTNWLRALKAAYGYDPVVVTISSPSQPLTNGFVFCRVTSWLTGQRLVSLPFSDHCEPLSSSAAESDQLLFHIRQWVDTGKWKYVEIRPTHYQPGDRIGLCKSVTYRLHSLDLSRSEQELFEGFHKSCVQRKIRKAEREKLKYEEGASEFLLKKFYRLLVSTRRRQYLPPQPLAWFRALIDVFGDDLKIRVASKDDVPIASILTLSHKKSMVYKYGCSDARFHRLGGMAFLFWQAIREAKEKGLDEFEMGRSNIDNLGLISFKEHWGAVGKPLSYWAYPHSPHTNQSTFEKAVLRCLIPATPDSVLAMVGKHLYRHIG